MPTTENFANDPRIRDFWKKQLERIQAKSNAEYRELTKNQILPLARIKKIMKIEDSMISGEGPILVAKAAEFLIEELTLRAWLHAESNRRKTLQKGDIANAAAQSDMFDFLIDIVPRPGAKESTLVLPRPVNSVKDESVASTAETPATFPAPAVQYVLPQDAENGENAQPMQYYIPCDTPQNGASVHVEMEGQVFEATQVGPSIPFQCTPGQTFLINGQSYQIAMASSAAGPPNQPR